MSANLNPYLAFRDQAAAALRFYQGIFGGELTLNTFKEFHASDDPSEDDKIMHGMLTGDNGIVFMAADTPNSMELNPGNSISMSLSGDDDAILSGYYDQLADGATNVLALNQAPWGDKFGMLTDRFGVMWMVNIAGSGPST